MGERKGCVESEKEREGEEEVWEAGRDVEERKGCVGARKGRGSEEGEVRG